MSKIIILHLVSYFIRRPQLTVSAKWHIHNEVLYTQRTAYEIHDKTHFPRSSPLRDFSMERNSTCEITRKLDHFAGSFSSGSGKSIPIDSIITTRSSEGIPNISLKIRVYVWGLKTRSTNSGREAPPRNETTSYFLAVRSPSRLMYPRT